MPRGTKNNTSSKRVDLKEKGEEEADMLTENCIWRTNGLPQEVCNLDSKVD